MFIFGISVIAYALKVLIKIIIKVIKIGVENAQEFLIFLLLIIFIPKTTEMANMIIWEMKMR